MSENGKEIIPREEKTAVSPFNDTPLKDAGQLANRIAGNTLFRRYLSQKSENTIKRHARDLELFAEYLLDIGIKPEHGVDFQHTPTAWHGMTWGIVEGYIQWLLREGYAISTINARLSTVKVYANMAVKAGVIAREEGLLIQSVRGFSRSGGQNVDSQREQSRMEEITYAYVPEGSRKTVVVSRQNTKKRSPTLIDKETAVSLKTIQNDSAQAARDALMMCLLLDHGLRASEVALVHPDNFNQAKGTFTFFRPKVKGTDHEYTTHELTEDTQIVLMHYLENHYPPTLGAPLILATSRLKKDGTGGELLERPLNRVRISERVAYLGKQRGIVKLSAHDCRHYCATQMARLGYGIDELMAWFGWTSAQTAVRYINSVDVKKRYKG